MHEPVLKVMGLDFETYSDVDLRKHGLARYVASPNFKVLLAAVSWIEDDFICSAVLDFVADEEEARERLLEMLTGAHIVAHNAMFEQVVLTALGADFSMNTFVDSAMMARAAGLGGSLEAAAPQLLGVDKMASGKDGIMLFCIPGTYQMDSGDGAFDPQVVTDHPEQWAEFVKYCALDAALSLKLMSRLLDQCTPDELHYSACTMLMNSEGWHVDLPLVAEMNRRYQQNMEEEILRFRLEVDGAEDLNLFSSQQLIKWCGERGIRAKSFDEQHVASMLEKLAVRLDRLDPESDKRAGYEDVVRLLRVKQALGGSSLKKLQTIMDTTMPNGMLYDQYLHAGASTTLRTTGRSVQMQNLKRLGGKGDDVSELFDPTVRWDNAKLARNLRQVFTAKADDGVLVVGDFSAVESRGLAWLSGEDWKLEAYRNGIGVYEMQAAKFYGIDIADVVPEQRQFAKVGELSCGYEAGPEAVQDFAEKMGVPLTMGEAKKLVWDFRTTNEKTVAFWRSLHEALQEVSEIGLSKVQLPEGSIVFETGPAVPSLQELTTRKLSTLLVRVDVPGRKDPFRMTRIFHGFSNEGRGFTFWKSSARKTGDLWTPTYVDPKTGYKKNYSLYGGKLAGILTQSLCREIFMHSLSMVTLWSNGTDNVRTVGQFHDEIVLDWRAPVSVIDPDLDATVGALDKVMSHSELPGFPLACEIKTDYRYTK
jgi:DNA polymerase